MVFLVEFTIVKENLEQLSKEFVVISQNLQNERGRHRLNDEKLDKCTSDITICNEMATLLKVRNEELSSDSLVTSTNLDHEKLRNRQTIEKLDFFANSQAF